ncbi:MAG: Protein MraZ [Candidatus Magasanikbacteria bacterium GW2011_GWC2_40_17]|uniref:Transcriptional regulator MraZ n=1 Tax=Candidatus Magasanikbacteria bacterium GW2011_GWA2_42_32 TaxID=1619039 RepID=A0A0G1A7I8_9BACT|nr:MAG: Protein MraZ [Candidatus Magasanikbacteria bacterium GW2011_GWC2_40_17]KKS56914.1 MAG: Protein MraZ [Candidatus Magasanikbacteria bacterium GW2011_GWA2_42_32]OGH85516.1 MAG: cell division/cell wall cluster transcriptional repressor MraZ [Candidatus Magasanikbacteria bacterium RIFOXYB2_FULL_38_10]
MFIGEFHHAVDDKSRLAIPVKFRLELKDGAVITRGLDSCLFVFSKKEWKNLAEKITALPLSQANSRAFARLMLSGAMDVKMDKQGRVIVPDYLNKYAGLKKQVVVTGLYSRLEVWDEEAWEKYKQNTEKQSEEIAERMGELGI